MATHSSILTYEIPWTEEPGGLQSMGSQRVWHNWVTEHSKHRLLPRRIPMPWTGPDECGNDIGLGMANWWITFWDGAHLHLLVSGPVASGAYSVNSPFTHCSAQPGEVSVLRLATQTTAPSPPTSSEAGVSPRPLSPSHLCVLCLVTQSCPTLCNPMDCSLPGSSVHGDSPGKNNGVGCHALLHGIFPTQGLNPSFPHCRPILYYHGSPRILEWVAYPFSRGMSQPRHQTGVPCIADGFFTR